MSSSRPSSVSGVMRRPAPAAFNKLRALVWAERGVDPPDDLIDSDRNRSAPPGANAAAARTNIGPDEILEPKDARFSVPLIAGKPNIAKSSPTQCAAELD